MATYRVWVDARGVGMTLYQDKYIEVNAEDIPEAERKAKIKARAEGLVVEVVRRIEER